MDLTELFRHWTYRVFAPGTLLRRKYESFKSLLNNDRKSLERIAELEDIYYGRTPVDWARVSRLVSELRSSVAAMVDDMMRMNPNYMDLPDFARKIDFYLQAASELPDYDFSPPYVLPLVEAREFPACSGNKAANLSRVVEEAGLPSPEGFVVTCAAFHYYLEYNELRPKIETLLSKVRLEQPGFSADVCTEIQRLILEGEVPPAVEDEMRDAAAKLVYADGGQSTFAVRSSALGEDSEASFAGQYESVLGVGLSDLKTAYKKVLAGKYNANAVTYRIRFGLADAETPMAALVLKMIEPDVSGVIYTRGLSEAECDVLDIYSVEGRGSNLVGGSASPEVISVARCGRTTEVVRALGGGAPQAISGEVPADEFILNDSDAETLAEWGIRIEQLFGRPQDIEWCRDGNGRLHILQARPLYGAKIPTEEANDDAGKPEIEAEPLISGGVPASPGVGIGAVRHCPMVRELENLPENTVLVCETLSPSYAGVMERLAAVVTDTGSKASHFASVAREFGLPVIVDTKYATRTLQDGTLVTVHADEAKVYEGEVEELLGPETRKGSIEDTPFFKRLSWVMEYVSPLNLTDPESRDFRPDKCRSMHDLTRFCHETAVAEMFSLVGRGSRGLSRAKQLESDMPLYMHVLDLDGGLRPETMLQEKVTPKDITSPLMKAVWKGLTHKSVDWSGLPPAYDWGGYEKMSGGFVSPKSKHLSSYALLARDYIHLMLRFGYHFAVVDSMCVDDQESNYVQFRFKGGGGTPEQRLLRSDYISKVLKRSGYRTKITGDMLDAQYDRAPRDNILEALSILGLVLGKTRLMDMSLHDESEVDGLVETFYREL
jgi:pyruvate,water dikinase